MNASGFASIFVLFLMARPEKRIFWTVLGTAVVLEAYYLLAFLPSTLTWSTKFVSSGGGFAVAGLLGLLCQSMLGPSLPGKTRARIMTRLALMLAFYPFTSAATLGALSQATPLVYDSHAYLLDGSLGFQMNFTVARFLESHSFLGLLFDTIYSRLPIWVVIGVALNVSYEKECYFDLLSAYLLAGVLVMGFYYILPMVGVDDYLGSHYWPLGEIPPTVPPVAVAAPDNFPRSCLPSMHAGWILLTFFCVRRINRSFALFFGGLTVITIFSAMSGPVGHYFVDFFPSFPFVLGCLALTSKNVPGNRDWKLVSLLYGFGATTAVAALIRGYGPGLANYPGLVWPSLLIMVGVTIYLEHKLAATTLELDPSEDAGSS